MTRTPAFDVSRLSNATRILLGGGVLLLIDSFLTWQRDCPSLAGVEPSCTNVHSMWGGSGAVFGVLAGILLLAMLAWEGLRVANVAVDIGAPVDAAKVGAYLGLGVLAMVLIKFIFVLTSAALGAWLGLVLALAIGYGAWMRLQEPAEPLPPAPPTSNGGMTNAR